MDNPDSDIDLASRVAAAWPPAAWCDVHVMVAVSGGGDSMALLRSLLEVKERAGGAGRILAGHVNHQLRGEESLADEAWLIGQCERLGVPLSVERANTLALASEQGDGVEAAAREIRYQLLGEMAERVGARYLAVAHTSDDQVETVLFRLVRGTGLRGLAGMPKTRALTPSVTLMRPMLGSSREELRQYLRSCDQPFRDDASNDSLHFTRNRIRRDLLPYLRENFNEDVDAALLRAAHSASEARSVIEGVAANLLIQCHPTSGESSLTLTTLPLVGQPEYLVCEVLRLAWRESRFPEQGMTNHWWRKLAALAQSREASGSLNLPGNVLAKRGTAGVLALVARGPA
jgi:tRNA(Ile)-lysidine synthase